MPPILALAATASLLAAAPVFAQAVQDQGPGANQAPSASETLNPGAGAGAPPIPGGPKIAPTAPGAPTGQAADASAKTPVIPSDWGGDSKDWTLHLAACAKAYPSYDQTTDMFKAPSGREQKCMLAMGKGGAKKR